MKAMINLNDIRLSSEALPSKQDEKWRYSDLSLLNIAVKKSFSPISNVPSYLEDNSFYYLVIIDGKYHKKESILPPQEHITILSKDIDELQYKSSFLLKSQVSQNLRNNHCIVDINIIKNIDKPLKVMKFITSNSNFFMTDIKIDKNCELQLFETIIQKDDEWCMVNDVVRIRLDKNSKCQHFFQSDIKNIVKSMYSLEVNCNMHSSYKNYNVQTKYKSYRFEADVHLNDKYSLAGFYGVCMAERNQFFDYVVDIKHHASDTYSNQHYNQFLNNYSSGSFYSNVVIPKHLNNVEAHQMNKNVIVDKYSKAYSRPILRIDSEDVKCSHGATISNISQNALDYCSLRGIKYSKAKKLFVISLLKSIFTKCNLKTSEVKFLYAQIDNTI